MEKEWHYVRIFKDERSCVGCGMGRNEKEVLSFERISLHHEMKRNITRLYIHETVRDIVRSYIMKKHSPNNE